jgi:L-Ala-D/L-Glu epimerase
MNLHIERVSFPYRKPFAITGKVYTSCDTIRVTVEKDGVRGVGEALGVDYLGESIDSIGAQLDDVTGKLGPDPAHLDVRDLLAPGGARNALDCALWDWRAKHSGKRVWELLGLAVGPVCTVFTIGIDEPGAMGRAAAEAARLPRLKIKLDAQQPIERLETIRAARPDATLVVDVNQGWDLHALRDYLPHLERLGIAMLEQPLPRGADDALESIRSSVPLGGDESFQHAGEFEVAARRYDVLNIKLDKCGGLTEAMDIVRLAQQHDKRLMVGCMVGSSYSMAPALVVAQHCEFVDIDGPLLLAEDAEGGLTYRDGGVVDAPSRAFWG